ncbi:hypothetical protein LTR17_004633 [Elasticomyces elasticus]|nr:hypothetical protein LTR17_004633 [Elasticomyces elasticus]
MSAFQHSTGWRVALASPWNVEAVKSSLLLLPIFPITASTIAKITDNKYHNTSCPTSQIGSSMMATSTAPVIQDCPLMRLPPELRDSIYELAVVEKYTLTISTISYDCNHQESHQPALAKTCRQLRNEVLAVYFRSNNFAIRVAIYSDPYVRELHDDFRSVHAWLARMTAEHRRMLGKVIICSGMVGEEYHRRLFENVTAGLRAASPDGTVLWAWGGEKDDEKCIAWRHGTETGHYWLNIIG